MATEAERGPPSSESLSDISRSTARYLFAISVLSEADTKRTTTGELQEYLDVAPASVSEMVLKLEDHRLVEYEKYQGVTLTDRGKAVATEAGWRFCVVTTFFESVLDADVTEETAFDMGFVLPKDGLFRLRNFVDSACLGLCPASDDDSNRCVV